MANLNRVLLIGRLTRDPELRYTPQGTPVCDLGLAVNHNFRAKDGTVREETAFLDVTVWGRQAENCKNYLKRGREVFVEGRLVLDRWEQQVPGPEGTVTQKRSKLRITAQTVQFLGGGPRAETVPESDAGGMAEPDLPPEEPPPETPF